MLITFSNNNGPDSIFDKYIHLPATYPNQAAGLHPAQDASQSQGTYTYALGNLEIRDAH